jgi:hypothetical protein
MMSTSMLIWWDGRLLALEQALRGSPFAHVTLRAHIWHCLLNCSFGLSSLSEKQIITGSL